MPVVLTVTALSVLVPILSDVIVFAPILSALSVPAVILLAFRLPMYASLMAADAM